MAQKLVVLMNRNIVVPFCFLPLPLMKTICRPVLGAGNMLASIFPALELELKQSDLHISKEEYGAITLLLFLFYFIFFGFVFFAIARVINPEKAIPISLSVSFVIALLVLLQLFVYPKIIIKKKVREIERNLMFALRTILIQMKSGVTLFDALKVVARGNFGVLSSEFKKAITEISAGKDEKNSLDELAVNNPSIFFRRTIWQIVNGMRAGADTSDVLKQSIDSLAKEQSTSVRKYGEQLKLLSLVYMMLGTIIPALGITFLIVLTSFPQLKITEMMFWSLLALVVVSEFMYLGIMKSKRPNLIGDV